MTKQRIQIENLKIRLPRSAASNAREIAGELGHAILRGIAESVNGRTGEIRIDEVSAGRIRVADGAGAIRERAAAGIMAGVRKKLG